MIRSATNADWPAIENLLRSADLPLEGANVHNFFVTEVDGQLIACAALERYGRTALLRSVAVDPAQRGAGIGANVVRRVIDAARQESIESIVLLTTTAESWFPRFGFRPTVRDAIAGDVTQSAEFRGACPSTAVVMTLELSTNTGR